MVNVLGNEVGDPPQELLEAVLEFFPSDQVDSALKVSYLESGWNAFATRDTRDPQHPCGAVIGHIAGTVVSAEWSIGWYQINACNLPPDWTPEHLYNTRHNVGTAHAMWSERGWSPWFFSAKRLGLL